MQRHLANTLCGVVTYWSRQKRENAAVSGERKKSIGLSVCGEIVLIKPSNMCHCCNGVMSHTECAEQNLGSDIVATATCLTVRNLGHFKRGLKACIATSHFIFPLSQPVGWTNKCDQVNRTRSHLNTCEKQCGQSETNNHSRLHTHMHVFQPMLDTGRAQGEPTTFCHEPARRTTVP